MKKFLLLSLVACLGLPLSGCVLFHGYALPVQQGNVLSEAKVNQIHTGMTKGQVQNIMGSPVYITTFNANRYDYVYTYQVINRPRHEKRVIISFRNGGVSNVKREFGPKVIKQKVF